jgi:enoyl-CoA hydratase/carnithine racemase
VLQKVRQGRVLRLTLDRPEKRNAINNELSAAIVEAVEGAVQNPSVGAILLTGSGTVFCAGMDLDEVAGGVSPEVNSLQEQLFTLGARSCKPLIAAVGGAALGGGTGLVANCHIVIAEPSATFGLTEIRLGLWPFLIYRALGIALGERRTLELSLTGRIFGSEEARDLGLVHEIAPDAGKRAQEVAEAVAGFSPKAIQSGLSFVQDVRGMDWEKSGRMARRFRDQVLRGADFQEGIRAFREKRPPRWPSLQIRNAEGTVIEETPHKIL